MSEGDIREAVARYLAELLPLEGLRDSLPDGVELDEANEPDLRKLTLTVMGLIAEVDAGDTTVDELRTRLIPFAAYTVTSTFAGGAETARRASSTTEVSAGADSELVGVSG
jgi:hypothetical protein